MTSGTVSPRLSAYDDARRAAVDAAADTAEYLRRVRAARQREAVALVRTELRRRAPSRARDLTHPVLLVCVAAAIVCATLALVVSSIGLFAS